MLSFDFFQEFFDSSSILDNKYKILQTIGEGRYAKVKLAINIENKKKYAIKIMREDQINTANKLESFLNEVQILSSIRNNHIVQIEHANLMGEYKKPDGRVKKVVYYAMKYAEFGELFSLLQVSDNFTEPQARYYFQQLVSGLAYLQKEGIGHRDIKTENIVIDNKLRLRLADFGCACRSIDKDQSRISFSNQHPVGSPEYNAPEVTNNSEERVYYAEQIDIFACASVLFVMVMKSIPFNSSMFDDPYYSRLCKKDSTQFWKIFDPDYSLSNEFKDLIEKMMNPVPEQRITLEQILQHPWYQGPTPSEEEVRAELLKRASILIQDCEKQMRENHSRKMRKWKISQGSSNLKLQPPQRTGSKLENLKQKMQSIIMDINHKIEKDRKYFKQQKQEIRMKLIEDQEGFKENDCPNKSASKNNQRTKSETSITLPTTPYGDHNMEALEDVKDKRRVLSAEAAAQQKSFDMNTAKAEQINRNTVEATSHYDCSSQLKVESPTSPGKPDQSRQIKQRCMGLRRIESDD